MIRSLFTKKYKKVNFFDCIHANEFLDIVSSMDKEGNEGAIFLSLGRHSVIAEKMAEDLFVSNVETCRRYATKLIGFIERPKKHLFINFYRAEKLFYESLRVGDFRRNNSHEIIENLIISTAIRFDLGYQNSKSANRLGSDWINFLFEVVSDAIDDYKWISFQLALSILSFHFYQKDWYKVLLTKYEEHIAQLTDDELYINRSLYDEIKRRNGETEMFENLLNNVVIPRMNAARDWKLDNHEENAVCSIINFYKHKS